MPGNQQVPQTSLPAVTQGGKDLIGGQGSSESRPTVHGPKARSKPEVQALHEPPLRPSSSFSIRPPGFEDEHEDDWVHGPDA